MKSLLMLVLNHVCLMEHPYYSSIHCPCGICPHLWIQSGHGWRLSAIRRTRVPFLLLTWSGSFSRWQGNGLPHGFLAGVHAWQNSRTGNGCGGCSLTIIIFADFLRWWPWTVAKLSASASRSNSISRFLLVACFAVFTPISFRSNALDHLAYHCPFSCLVW